MVSGVWGPSWVTALWPGCGPPGLAGGRPRKAQGGGTARLSPALPCIRLLFSHASVGCGPAASLAPWLPCVCTGAISVPPGAKRGHSAAPAVTVSSAVPQPGPGTTGRAEGGAVALMAVVARGASAETLGDTVFFPRPRVVLYLRVQSYSVRACSGGRADPRVPRVPRVWLQSQPEVGGGSRLALRRPFGLTHSSAARAACGATEQGPPGIPSTGPGVPRGVCGAGAQGGAVWLQGCPLQEGRGLEPCCAVEMGPAPPGSIFPHFCEVEPFH